LIDVTAITKNKLDNKFLICNNSYIMETVLIIGIIVSGFILGWELGIILSSSISMNCKKYRR
jgi:hypothetical protein